MNQLGVIVRLIKSDFKERTRRYSFLVTLGVMILVGYAAVPAADSNVLTVDLGNMRGIYNSAWIGSIVALISSMVLSLPGFYLVKNTIQRDRQTGVGQIIATTPLSKMMYLVGKLLSNFLFLVAIILPVVVAGAVMQLVRGEVLQMEAAALLKPFLFAVFPTLLLVASIALLFETVQALRGGFGNLVYFALWISAIVISMSGVSFGAQGAIQEPTNDLFGASVIGASMHKAAHAAYPKAELDLGIGYTVVDGPIRTFQWEGVRWNGKLVVERMLWLAVSPLLVFGASLFFHRFDPARRWRIPQSGGRWIEYARSRLGNISITMPKITPNLCVRIPPLRPFWRSLLAELRLLIKGLPWWWYIVMFALMVMALITGGDPAARRPLLVISWIWPVLVWSKLGTREEIHKTGPIVYSAPKPIRRQFIAMWIAGVLVTLFSGVGIGLHVIVQGNSQAWFAWGVAALFIPSLALVLGTWTKSSKSFQALYVAWWYVGPLSGLGVADFMGLSRDALAQNMPLFYLALAAILLALAVVGRYRRIRA